MIMALSSYKLLFVFFTFIVSIHAAHYSIYPNPDLIHIGINEDDGYFNIQYYRNALAKCEDKFISGMSDDVQNINDHVLNKIKEVVGSWMFQAGIQSFHLQPGEHKTVSLTLTLTHLELLEINKYLEQPSFGNFVKMIPIFNKFFTLNKKSSYNFDNNNPKNLRKQSWVGFLFDIIISLWNKETLLVVVSLVLTIFLLKIIIFGADMRVVLIYFFIAVFFVGFLWTWSYLYQKAVVEQYVKKMRYEHHAFKCKPDNSFFGFLKSIIGYKAPIDECKEYYYATKMNPLITVPPTIALSETISLIFIHPAVLIAKSMQEITKILFGNMFGGIYFGTPIVMLIFMFFFLWVFVLVSGRHVRFKIAYFGTIEIGSLFQSDPPQQNIENRSNPPGQLPTYSNSCCNTSQNQHAIVETPSNTCTRIASSNKETNFVSLESNQTIDEYQLISNKKILPSKLCRFNTMLYSNHKSKKWHKVKRRSVNPLRNVTNSIDRRDKDDENMS